jgi:hypothetical protein
MRVLDRADCAPLFVTFNHRHWALDRIERMVSGHRWARAEVWRVGHLPEPRISTKAATLIGDDLRGFLAQRPESTLALQLTLAGLAYAISSRSFC